MHKQYVSVTETCLDDNEEVAYEYITIIKENDHLMTVCLLRYAWQSMTQSDWCMCRNA